MFGLGWLVGWFFGWEFEYILNGFYLGPVVFTMDTYSGFKPWVRTLPQSSGLQLFFERYYVALLQTYEDAFEGGKGEKKSVEE